MSNNKFWNVEVEEPKVLTPFYSWGKKPCRILLEKAINQYEIEEKEGQYGISCYIEIKIWENIANEFQYMKLKVDSKRLRVVLVECSKLKFPAVIDLIRDGTGFETKYSFVEVKPIDEPKTKKKSE